MTDAEFLAVHRVRIEREAVRLLPYARTTQSALELDDLRSVGQMAALSLRAREGEPRERRLALTVRHAMIDEVRRVAGRRTLCVPRHVPIDAGEFPWTNRLASSAPLPDDALAAARDARALRAAMGHLTPRQREAVEAWAHGNGHASYGELLAARGVTPAAMTHLKRKGLSKLCMVMGATTPHEPDDGWADTKDVSGLPYDERLHPPTETAGGWRYRERTFSREALVAGGWMLPPNGPRLAAELEG